MYRRIPFYSQKITFHQALKTKDRILLWPRSSLVYFGVAKILQEKYDCDLFIIINDNHISQEFFKKQDLVNFQKVLYYNDYIFQKMKKPDIEYLKSFEKKYEINLWNLAYSDRFFYHYNAYHTFTKDEILCLIEYGCKFFEEIINEVHPDYLITDVTAFHEDELLHQICRKKNIKILGLSDTRFGYRSMVSSVFDRMDNLHNDLDTGGKKIRAIEELRGHVRNYSSQHKIFENKFKKSIIRRLRAGIRFMILVNNKKYTRYYPNWGRTRLKIIINQTSLLFKSKYHQLFLDRNSSREINTDIPFIYFPLHYEPERTILIPAPFYTNQLEVIRNIAKSIPVGYKLFVKDHPLMRSSGWRNTSFYKKIMNLPNTILVHPSISNEEMVKKCALVVTIAGTTGMEAAFYQKPSIVLADTIFSPYLPSVHRVRNIEELPNAIQKSLQTNVNADDLNKYVNRVEENSFEFDYQGLASIYSSFLLWRIYVQCQYSNTKD